MGSQTLVKKKLRPNLWRARTEPCQSSKTRSRVTRTTEAANKKVIMRAISSPSRRRLRKEREPATGPALGTVVVVVATLFGKPYWTLLMATNSLVTTSLGSFAYKRLSAKF